jgi:predicted nucleotidyltransferase component of viral defense system
MQLKGWIKNKSKETGISANVLMQNYLMERLLERISLSPYREKIILKGGFLIAAMVGAEKRSTLDMDTTLKHMPVNREKIEDMLNQIIATGIDDGVTFEIQNIDSIHETGEYNSFRVGILAKFHTIKMKIKIDMTTGDVIIPGEIEYRYKLMFEKRTIPVMAYNLYTILAEKIETILSRNVTNTRGRDFYDAYVLLSTNKDISLEELLNAIRIKAEERGSGHILENYAKYLRDIAISPEITKIWAGYVRDYPYAQNISMTDILTLIESIFL